MTLLLACGGGGSGGTAATGTPTMNDPNTPPPNPLTVFMPTAGSRTIQDFQAITDSSASNTVLSVSSVAEEGNFGNEVNPTRVSGTTYLVPLPGNAARISVNTSAPLDDISLITNGSYTSNFTSMITNGVTVGDVTFARGRIAATRVADSSPLGFETFAGWLDGSVFGTTQITIGASGSEEYRFISYIVGVPAGSNPSATGSETSGTWEGSAVATIKADRTFVRGDATIDIDDLSSPDVDVTLDNWRMATSEALSTDMDAITYTDLQLASGAFEDPSGNAQVFGRFYGTGHNEVGGRFNTMDVIGAFGGTRQ